MPDAFFCISVVIWVYVSSVKDALVCPKMPDTYTHMTTEMQKKASGIVGNFLDEIM